MQKIRFYIPTGSFKPSAFPVLPQSNKLQIDDGYPNQKVTLYIKKESVDSFQETISKYYKRYHNKNIFIHVINNE